MISLSLSLSVCLARRRPPLPSSFRPYLSKLTSPSTARRLVLTLSSVRIFVCPLFSLLSLCHYFAPCLPLNDFPPFREFALHPPRSLGFYSLFLVGSAWSHSYFPLLKPSLFFSAPPPVPRAALLSRLFSRSLHLPPRFCPAIVRLSRVHAARDASSPRLTRDV